MPVQNKKKFLKGMAVFWLVGMVLAFTFIALGRGRLSAFSRAGFYEIGAFQIPSFSKIVGERECVRISSSTSAEPVGNTHYATYEFRGDAGNEQDLTAYANYLHENEGFDEPAFRQGEIQLYKESAKTNRQLFLTISYNENFFTIDFTSRVKPKPIQWPQSSVSSQ